MDGGASVETGLICGVLEGAALSVGPFRQRLPNKEARGSIAVAFGRGWTIGECYLMPG